MLEWREGEGDLVLPEDWNERLGKLSGTIRHREAFCPRCGARITAVAIPPQNITLPVLFIHGDDYGLTKVANLIHRSYPMVRGSDFDPVASFFEEEGTEFSQEYHNPVLREQNDSGHRSWHNLRSFA